MSLKKKASEETVTMNTERLNNAAEFAAKRFNLSGYTVIKFNDKGKSIDITFTNGEFVVSVSILDVELYDEMRN